MIAAMTVFKLMPPASAFAVALETVSRGVPALCILWHSAWSSSSNACSFGSIAILLCGSKQFRRLLVDPVEEPVKKAAAAPAEAERDKREHLLHGSPQAKSRGLRHGAVAVRAARHHRGRRRERRDRRRSWNRCRRWRRRGDRHERR